MISMPWSVCPAILAVASLCVSNRPQKRSKLVALCAVLVVLLCGAGKIALAQTAAPRRVTERIDESRRTTLVGHVRPFLKNAIDRGPVDGSEQVGLITLMLSRTPQQQLDLDALVDQMHNRNSANYHKWLTPEEFGARFEPADEDVAAVKAWLESKGLTVLGVAPSKTHIDFTGTVGQLRDAFHVDIHHVSISVEEHLATTTEPQIPAALAPVVAGLHKLDDFSPKPLVKNFGKFTKDRKTGKVSPAEGTNLGPNFTFTCQDSTNCGTGILYAVVPQDFYTIYNENPLLSAGINGAGQTIAVIEEVKVAAADVNTFRSQFGLPTYPATPNATAGGVNYYYGSSSGLNGDASCLTPVSQSSGKSSGEESEADIDLQWAGTVAPNAIIDFVACGGTNGGDGSTLGSLGVDHSAQYIVNYLSSTVVAASMSYGECEGDMTSTNMTYYNGQWEQYAAEGITPIVSSGDGGAEQCYQDDAAATSLAPSANGFGSSAYNVSAGGTDFGDAYVSNNYATELASTWWSATNGAGESSAKSYIPETTWAGFCSNELFASYLQKAGSTTFGSNYTPWAICNTSYSVANGYTEVGGGAGGISTYNSIPTWQSVYGVGLNNTSSTYRNLPDVSLFASNGFWGHYLPYCESDAEACTQTEYEDGYLGAGGTSFVAPQLAGLMALINQKSNDRQGQADYTFYNLAAQEYGTPGNESSTIANCSGSGKGAGVGSSCIFYDISNDMASLQGGTITPGIYQPCYSTATDCYYGTNTESSGNKHIYGVNSAPGSGKNVDNLAFTAGPGYDDATGLGSVNIANLVNGWNTVSPAFASTTTLAVSASSIVYTGSVNLTATVVATGRGGSVAPAGTVEFFIGSTSGTKLGSGSIVSSCTGSGSSTSCKGTATLSSVAGSALNAGSNSIVAYFEGDGANDAPSTSGAQTVTVTSYPQSITFTTNAPSSEVYNGQFTVAATATSGLTVAFTSSGACSNSGATYTMTSGTGTCSVIANQAGNSNYAAAPQVTQTVNATPASQSISWNQQGPYTYGQSPVALTATGGASGNAVTYTVNSGPGSVSGSTLTITGAGSIVITANQAGNTNYSAAPAVQQTIVVNKASQTITFTTNAPSNEVYNGQFTVAATATSGLTVAFTSSGACSNSGATYTMTSGTGTCSVIANQAGNGNYSAASQVTQTVNATLASQSISFTTNAPSSEVYNGQFTVAATATSGLTVAFTASGVCSNSGATYTMTSGTGICSVIANQVGNSNYAAAPQVTQTVNATPVSQIISFAPPVTPVNYGVPPITLSASASSGLPVAFSVLSGPATVNGSILTITGPGTVIVAADQAGDTDYAPAAEVTQTIEVNLAPTFTELASSPNPSTYGQSVTFNALLSTGGVSPTGSITFNDASNAIDSTTVTPLQTTNLVAYSQANATAWTSDETGPAAPTITADSGPDPFGGTNALQMTFPATGAGTSDSLNTVSVSGAFAEQTFTASVWLSAPSATTINFLLNEVGGSSASASNAVTVGTAWQRYSVSLPIPAPDSGASSLNLVLVNPSGQPAATINVFGAQVENATTEGPYVATYGTAQSGYGAIASFATSILISGSHPITAAYAGDSNDAASTSVTLTQFVNDATPSLSLASSANPSVYSNPVTFTASISNSLTGNITFYDGSTAIGTGALSGGTASLTTSALTAGSHAITAAWAGNADYNPVTSVAITQVVNQMTPAITWNHPSTIIWPTPLRSE